MDKANFLEQAKELYKIGDNNIGKAYEVYQKAVNGEEPFCIIGKMDDLKYCLSVVNPLDPNDVDIYENGEKSNFIPGNSNHEVHYLNIKSDDWTLLLNDAWLLGNIEAGKTFYLTKKDGFSSFEDVAAVIKSGNEARPLTVTARELVGLRCYGYKASLGLDGALIFEREDKSKAPNLEDYNNQRRNFMQKDDYEICKESLKALFCSVNWLRENKS